MSAFEGRKIRAVAVALIAAASCSHPPKRAQRVEEPTEYRIGREDLLEISVWRDPDLTRTVPVRPDGRVSLPLIGEVDVAGKTARAVAIEVERRLNPFIQDPKVAVIVREVNSPKVYVIGEVAHPGTYPLRGRLTVLQALSLAGGPNEFADKRGIVILRTQPKAERIEIDYGGIVAEGAGEDLPLEASDTIYVP